MQSVICVMNIPPVCVQEIYQDRKKFSEQVFKVASSDLVNMGIGVVSYTLKDVHDDQVLNVLGFFFKHRGLQQL